MKKKYFALTMIAMGWFGLSAQETITESATKNPSDNVTVYETEPGNANGKADYMQVTNSGTSNTIAAMFKFDLTDIPDSAEIKEARITLTATSGGFANIRIRVMEEGWSEGSADASTNVAAGVAAASGDVTWEYAEYGATPWSGNSARSAWSNSSPAVSAASIDANNRIIEFPAAGTDSSAIISMIQNWVSNPSDNHGFVLMGTSGTVDATIYSRHSNSNQPELYIVYEYEDVSNSVSLVENTDAIKVYPNPAVNTLNISGLNNSVERIEILDLSGRIVDVVSTNTVNETAVTVNLNGYNSGTYLLRVSDKENVSVNKFVVK